MNREVTIILNYEKCPPCNELICIDICPGGVFKMGIDGKPQVQDIISCTECGVCERMCPESAIKVIKDDDLENALKF